MHEFSYRYESLACELIFICEFIFDVIYDFVQALSNAVQCILCMCFMH